MEEWKVQFIEIINMNPIFKGAAVIIVGLLALFFAWWMRERWKEPLKGGFLVFVGLSIFIVLYGLYILVLQPNWWALPY